MALNDTLTQPTIEVSWGELVDKITILEIKEQRLRSEQAIANVRKELTSLTRTFNAFQSPPLIQTLRLELKEINQSLWDIENRIRAKEAAKTFDDEFIELARSVYFNNDKRALSKRQINELMSSELIEEKQYTRY